LSRPARPASPERPGEEQVEEQRLDEVVEVVAQRDLGGADLAGDAVEHAAAQPGTQRAGRGVGLEDVVHLLADRRVLDPVLPAPFLAGARDDVVLEVLVAGVHVDGHEREPDWRALAEDVEHLQQRPAVLAARQADHDAVAVFDHRVVGNRLGRFPGEPRLEWGA
jgi:hypothetical protein